MATPYLTLATFKTLTTLPPGYVDDVETVTPGWVDAQLAYFSSQIDARLAKRYDVPCASPYPSAVTGWLSRIVTVRVWLKRGVDPNDLQFQEIKADADAAWAEIKEAANSSEGLFELPLRADTNTIGITRGGPRSYSEQSPYVGFDLQSDTGRIEDSNRGGSYG